MTEEPEKVQVTRVPNQPPQERRGLSLLQRMYNALFPVIGGLVLDLTDLATFGPVGIYAGFFVGAIVGWLISSIYGSSPRTRLIWAILAGVYCMVPGTAFFPIATVISAILRFNKTS